MKTYNKIYTVHAWKDNNKFFTVVQGEGGVKYPRLKIIDDNGSIDLTGASITYTATLPRGSEEIVDATIIDAKQGIVEFEIKSSMTMYSGIAYGELNIVSDSKVLKVGGINLTISSATNGHEIEASEQFSALVEALRKVVTLTPEGTAVIPDGNITTEKLADNAITSNKIANNAITAEKLADTVLANKADKANTLAGYGIMDGIKDAAGTVRAVNLAADVINKFGEKVDSSELFDVTKSINLANLADYSQHQNGVTVTVAKGKISLSGTSTAATNFFLPLKSSITLRIDTPYCLSLQDFTTNNTGCVFYPAYNQNVIDSKWLLSEVSALKNAAATFTPIQYMFVNSIKIAIAANRLTDNSCYLQIEQNNQKTAYVDPEKIVQKIKPVLYQAPDYTMHYLYVSNDYNENTEGFGETKFNSILSANNSISDNSYHNRYTIVVMAGIYTDLQDKYAGMSDVGLVGYRGVMTKDYVYYESENIYNPAATVIKWDGATGFDKSTLKSEDIIKKCPFHLDLNVHTHIKGFTFDCKNIRYGIHLESGGTGYATNWVVGHCTFIWGGRADCVDYANKTTVPVFGCGHSFGEVGLIENCKIIPTHCTIGYQSHDNADNSDFGLPIKVGAKITIKDCDFGGTEIQARTLKGAYADTPNVLTLDGCINISAINKMYAAPADHCDWDIKGVS
ncbi:BppU family phage baseplate upper protein [Ruminococcus bromii]|uniref:BppU family phage baseplate upper protein n=1 Tax=Ruminococcus bromii TaxID=40518 RepID=UPI003FD8A9C1